jgi:hypothetical protein
VGEEWLIQFLPTACDFHGRRRDILHAANVGYGIRWLYFPSEGRHAEDFFARIIRWLQPGLFVSSKYVIAENDFVVILIKMTTKMKLCRIIYYSIVPWLLYMFRAILSLIIRSILTVITPSSFIHMYCCRLLSWLSHDSSRQQYM